MSHQVTADCIGCGACEYACPPGALHKTDDFLGIFAIDPFLCDDCGRCVSKCPADAIVIDPEWPECKGRGCPLSARRLAGFSCAFWQTTCPECGDTMWQEPENPGTWRCSRCDLGMRVLCPKIHAKQPRTPSSV